MTKRPNLSEMVDSGVFLLSLFLDIVLQKMVGRLP